MRLLPCIFLCVLFYACTNKVEDTVEPVIPEKKDTLEVTYTGTVRPILDNNCTVCHSGSNPPNNVNLTTYEGVAAVAKPGTLYGVISHAPGFPQMPFNKAKLPDGDIANIKKWIDEGFKNN